MRETEKYIVNMSIMSEEKIMKFKKIILAIFTSVLLTACQQTPGTILINNSDVKTEPSEEGENMTTSDISTNDIPTITITYENVNEEIELDGKTITFNGFVGKPDSLEGLCVYNSAVVDHKKYMENMYFIAEEYEGDVELVEKDEPGGKMYLMYDGIHEKPIHIAYLYLYENLVDYTGTWIPLSGETIPVNMTMDETIAKADEILARIGVNGFTLYEVKYYDEVPMEGYWPNGDYYSVKYRQYLQGVPIVIEKDDGRLGSVKVEIQERGIERVTIAQLNHILDRKIDKCISYEEALEIFKNYVCKSNQYENFSLESVTFEYLVKKQYGNKEYTYTAVPCWRFDVGPDGPEDIIIEAENGRMDFINNKTEHYYGTVTTLCGPGVEYIKQEGK